MQPSSFTPANGGYFGSMMTGNGGLGGNIGSFTSPPVGNDFLAFLKKLSSGMQGMGGDQQQGGGPSMLPPNSFSPFLPNGGQSGQQPDPMDAVKKAMAAGGQAGGAPFGSLDPSTLQGILQKLGMASGAGALSGI